MKLFAVYLGGRAPKCHTELHDVVFAIGETIEATYVQLLEQWFGNFDGLHIASWLELDIADGHTVTLSETPSASSKKLYFVNLGAYADGQFTEIHANTFLVVQSKQEAKSRAKAVLLRGWPSHVHTDDLHEVDDCIELSQAGRLHIHLRETAVQSLCRPVNGYHLIPEPAIQDYLASKPDASPGPA